MFTSVKQPKTRVSFGNLKRVSQYTKLYPFEKSCEGDYTKLKENVQTWLIRALNDPMVKILSKNSHLTRTQLETLLIDVLSENISGKTLKYDEKARLRLTRSKISRGAFNRTLRQAKENVTRAIYTVLLLGYLGIFESTTLDPYLEVANKLQDYVEAYRETINKNEKGDHLKAINMMREELETSLKQLSNPSSKHM
jgi:hypothetical protein